jgi:hypothetical protein
MPSCFPETRVSASFAGYLATPRQHPSNLGDPPRAGDRFPRRRPFRGANGIRAKRKATTPRCVSFSPNAPGRKPSANPGTKGARMDQGQLAVRQGGFPRHRSADGILERAAECAGVNQRSRSKEAEHVFAGLLEGGSEPDGARLRPGTPDAPWKTGGPNCVTVPEWQVHEYNEDFYILRESGCIDYEKPFLYLIFGQDKALLEDTGAGEVQTAPSWWSFWLNGPRRKIMRRSR